ncbi:conjugal transfer protein TraS [Salmonella enterica]|nr:conjugal transfer protein TraS [Salmonella enterica]EMD3382519.1 conjugal transfer protein TraS [Salmonella enterica]EMD3422896.1 conjugal transfer protein TraS [Salmonella enterica]EMD3477353.1 conjugal transfer protein TraS [Salmonella enterica]EMD3575877.1 conjugal transfer protein TraS [Salmonella enterica]
MRVTTDDLKKDVEMLLDDLKRNYEIPSVLNSVKFLSKVMLVALVMQCFLSILDFIIWGGEYRGGGSEAIIIYCIGFLGVLLLPSVVIFIACHSHVMIISCLSDEVRRKSILLKIAKTKFQYVFCFAILTNLVVGVCFVLNESAMVAFMGGSWFVTILIYIIIYNMMMSPYFTPAVVSGLSKVKESLTASPK